MHASVGKRYRSLQFRSTDNKVIREQASNIPLKTRVQFLQSSHVFPFHSASGRSQRDQTLSLSGNEQQRSDLASRASTFSEFKRVSDSILVAEGVKLPRNLCEIFKSFETGVISVCRAREPCESFLVAYLPVSCHASEVRSLDLCKLAGGCISVQRARASVRVCIDNASGLATRSYLAGRGAHEKWMTRLARRGPWNSKTRRKLGGNIFRLINYSPWE